MNILFFIGEYPNFGGTERVTTVLANAFTAEGDKVHIVSFKQSKGRDLDVGLSDKVTVHYLHLPVNCKDNDIAFRKILVENKIDVIFNQWCWPFYTARFINKARKGLNIKLLSINHGVPNQCQLLIVARKRFAESLGLRKIFEALRYFAVSKVVHWSVRYVYRTTDAYIVLSKGFEQVFKDYTGIGNPYKLTYMYNPMTIKTDYSQDYFPFKKKQLLYVGRMDKHSKRVDRMVDAWEVLSKKYPDWNFVLVGDGPHLDELRPEVQRRKIERVEFTGFEDPIEYYKDSQIFILTSDLEGFGLVVVEAMSYGVIPVVYGNYSSIFEIIDSGENGFITSVPYSRTETVAAISRLIEDRELRRKMSVEAQRKSKVFDLEETVARWKALIGSEK